MKYYLSTFILFFFLHRAAATQIWYVRHDATGLNNGTSWADAFTTLDVALGQALYGDTICVASGTYYPSPTNSREAHFLIRNGVHLFGGFSGTETQHSQRNWQLHPTILSGDIGVPGDAADNCYNVLMCREADSTTVLDGLIVEWGNANAGAGNYPSNYRRGGGLFIKPVTPGQVASPRIINCIFRHNKANLQGNAVYVEGTSIAKATPAFHHCRFEDNMGNGASQSVYYLVGTPDVTQTVRMEHNFWAEDFLLIYHTRGSLDIILERDTFMRYGISVIEPFYNSSNIQLKYSVFEDNAELSFSTDTYVAGTRNLSITNCTFANNKSVTDIFIIEHINNSICVYFLLITHILSCRLH